MTLLEKAGAWLLAILCTCAPLAAQAQFGRAWPKPPKIVVIGAEGDPRMMLVDEAKIEE